MTNLSIPLVIPSCDKYSDLWAPFFNFLFKFWPDCPKPVYLFSNTLDFSDNRVQVIKTGAPLNWSSEIKKGLQKVEATYVLLILEDYFVYEPVSQSYIEKLGVIAQNQNADFLRIGCFPSRYNSYWPYDSLPGHQGLGIIRPGSKYRINLQTAIWKKEALCELLVDGENPWEFEINGSERANNKTFKALCVIENKNKEGIHGPIMYIGGAVTKGKWMLDAIRLAGKNGIYLDSGKRPVETRKEEILRKFYVSTPLFIRPAYRYLTNKLGIKW